MNLTCCLVLLATLGAESSPKDDLARRGQAVLHKYCLECHGNDFQFPGLDMRDRVTLLKPSDPKQTPYLVPGKSAQSRIWQRVDVGEMPPDDQPQPSSAEKALLQQWIDAGAEFPAADRPERKFVGEATLLGIIAADLDKLPASRRFTTRYFSLVHLWNSALPDEHLALVRAAVSKLINSQSSQPRIAPPTAIDPDGLVLRIDLRDYGWENSKQWFAIMKAYPFGLQVRGDAAQKVYDLTGCEIPYLRADWFVYHASRPPLYHQLVTLPDFIGIPDQVGVLERLLGVNPQADFDKDREWRAGFSGEKSGVSDHNRMVARHDARYGYYWPSFDSAGDSGRQNHAKFPLGPKFSGREQPGAFDHDGGEMIFSLPNHLQAYMLSTAAGKRINDGPTAIVSDPNRFSGSNTVVNGISCMGCHKQGMISFEDTIRRQYEDRTGDIAEKVLRLFPAKADMDKLVDQDRQRFLTALDQAIGPFMRTGANDKRPVIEFPEPITAVAKVYDRPVSLADVARELGLPKDAADAKAQGIRATAAELATVIKFSESLRRLELLPLTVGEPLTRPQWEQAFSSASRELRLGIAVIVR